jgi:zinc transport system ATP-binding protein
VHTVDHRVNVVEVEHVSFAYGATEALRHVNLQIHRGDYLGIVGPNGSGKTTLLKIMLGLLTPSSGSVKLFGVDIRDFKDWPAIGYVPQKATHFDANFPATVEEVALMGRFGRRGLFRRITEQDRAKARDALAHVDMWSARQRLIGDLSGGQQQRVFIARALATEPQIVFLDEPTVGVEAHIRDEFYALLQKLNRDLHLTVVLITHDLEGMAHEAMHVACVNVTLFYHDSAKAFLKETHDAVAHQYR